MTEQAKTDGATTRMGRRNCPIAVPRDVGPPSDDAAVSGRLCPRCGYQTEIPVAHLETRHYVHTCAACGDRSPCPGGDGRRLARSSGTRGVVGAVPAGEALTLEWEASDGRGSTASGLWEPRPVLLRVHAALATGATAGANEAQNGRSPHRCGLRLHRGDRTRTCDPRFWRPMLYQLSYAPRP